MKNTGFILGCLLLALASGCTYNYPYSRSSIGSSTPPETRTSLYTVINNTRFTLRVYQDGKYLQDLAVGQVMGVKCTLFWRETVVSVTAETAEGFVGSASWIYAYGTPEVWTVTRLQTPQKHRY